MADTHAIYISNSFENQFRPFPIPFEPMKNLQRILENNKEWSARILREDPGFFATRESSQEPHFLWIGCSDSRVPAETVTGALPGEMFVHRNIGNQIWPTDLNFVSVLEYAVDVLNVKHVIICGHTNCGAIRAAYAGGAPGVVEHWLSDVRVIIRERHHELAALPSDSARLDRLSQLNVMRQLLDLSRTPTVLNAWARNQPLLLEGVVYDVATGLLKAVLDPIDSLARSEELLRGV
jgi:carbonic anhydrase